MKRIDHVFFVAVFAVSVTAQVGCTCAGRPVAMGDSASSGGGTTAAGTGGTTEGPPPDVAEGCHPEDSGECDPWCQDCPEGEKCLPEPTWEGPWAPTKCVPVADVGQPAGASCTQPVVPYPDVYDGTDDCDEDAACTGFFRDNVTNEGTNLCQAFCRGTPEQPDCTFVHPMSVCKVTDPRDPLPTCSDPCAPDAVSLPGRPRCPRDTVGGDWSCAVVSATTEEVPVPGFVATLPVPQGHTMRCASIGQDGNWTQGGPCSMQIHCGIGMVCLASDLVPYCADPGGQSGFARSQ